MGISRQQFEQMKNRVSSVRRPTAVLERAQPPSEASSKRHQVFLGVDPSLRGTGYGVVQFDRKRPQLLAQGTIKVSAGWERSRCLVQIAHTLRDVILRHQPTVC